MKKELSAVLEELERMKREGVESVVVRPETMERLRAEVTQSAPASLDVPARERAPAEAVVAGSGSTKASVGAGNAGSNPAAADATGGFQGRSSPTEPVRSGSVPDSPATPDSNLSAAASPSMPARKKTRQATSMLPPPPTIELPEGDKRTRWEWLRERVLNCEVCNAHVRPGKQVVFGVGDIDADIFFCGEAPGADEEVQGEPFVGRAGQLLTKIIQAMGLDRDRVYIGNIMNWRPEMPDMASGNRPPTTEEMSFCLPYLQAQVAVVQPKVIVALGNTAVTGLLGPDPKRRMGAIRGKWFSFGQTPLLVTYHPSYILRNGSMATKRIIWEDMLQVMEKVGLPISDKQRGFFT